MSEPKVHPAPKVPRRSKAILWALAILVAIVVAYSIHVMRDKPKVDVEPPGAGLTGGPG